MKQKIIAWACLFLACGIMMNACQSGDKQKSGSTGSTAASGGMSAIKDDVSQKTVVQVAVGSPDHTTLVAALQAAGLVDVLANPGPFTVFAPTNAAFDKLPKGTVEDLLKPEKKGALKKILQHHVTVSMYNAESFKDGQVLSMAGGEQVKLSVQNGHVMVGEANIIGTVQASNGIVHVIDAVLLPPAKK